MSLAHASKNDSRRNCKFCTATESFPDTVLPTALNDDHTLGVDDHHQEDDDDEPFVALNENEPIIIVDQNDHEASIGVYSRDEVLSIEQFSEKNELELSKTDEAMLSVYHFASQRGVSISFIEDLFMLLRRLDSTSGGPINLSTTKVHGK